MDPYNTEREQQNLSAQNEVTTHQGWTQSDDERVAGWYTDNDGNSIKDRD